MKAYYNDYEQLKEYLEKDNKIYDMALIDKAYNVALKAHESQ